MIIRTLETIPNRILMKRAINPSMLVMQIILNEMHQIESYAHFILLHCLYLLTDSHSFLSKLYFFKTLAGFPATIE
jgi:hypothetical protein